MSKKVKKLCENQTNRIKTIRYIRYSFEKALRERQEYTFFGDIYVYVKDPIPESIDLAAVLGEVESTIPHQLAKEIDTIYVGRFEELAERELQALYKDGALYLTNLQHSEEQMIKILFTNWHTQLKRLMALIYIWMDQLRENFWENGKGCLIY